MGLLNHMAELRVRLLRAFIGIAIGTVVGWFLFKPIMSVVTAPLTKLNNAQLTITTIGGGFDLQLRVAFWAGIIVSSPWWIWQIASFIAPALKKRERNYVVGFGVAGTLLFLLGAASGVWMAPRAVTILQSFVPDGAASMFTADLYLTFYMRLVIACGISMAFPVLLVILNFAGVLSARAMLKGWRWATVAAFTFAAIANPLPQPWPMIIQAGLILIVYFGACGIAALHDRKKKKRSLSEDDSAEKTETKAIEEPEESPPQSVESRDSEGEKLLE
ncbi:MAG: twin-arginine translocase subunit TatC [Actinomycetaceae bacterium]|nr:twin-arginine translocase subunit TatC [Actinomycetaceae bacterium]